MSTHSNHLSRPLRERVPEAKSKAPPVPTPLEDLPEQLTQYLKGRQRALYLKLLQDDPRTTVSPDSPDSLQEVLARLKEVEKLKTELEIIVKGTRNARQNRRPYS